MYTVITCVEANRVAKFIEVDTLEEAESEQTRLAEVYPQAFVYPGQYCQDLYVSESLEVTKVPVPDPAALAQRKDQLFVLRDKLLEVVTGMQVDYTTVNDMVNANLCKDVKAALKEIQDYPTIANATTETEFKLAVVARWKVIFAPVPLEVKNEFRKYVVQFI